MGGAREQLAERLGEAAGSLGAALDFIGDHYGLDDPMFNELVEAISVAERVAQRIAPD